MRLTESTGSDPRDRRGPSQGGGLLAGASRLGDWRHRAWRQLFGWPLPGRLVQGRLVLGRLVQGRLVLGRLVLAACAAGVATAAGCGLDEYEALMATRLEQLRFEQQFEALAPPATVGSFPISIRFPKLFETADWLEPGGEDRNGNPITAESIRPPVLSNLPGMVRTGERLVEKEPGHRLACSVYLAIMPSQRLPARQWEAALLKQLQARWPKTGAWTTVEVPNPQQQPVVWRKLHATGPQLFEEQLSGEFQQQTLPGTLDLYLHEGHGWCVLWVVRVPDVMAEQTKLLDLGRLTAGTLVIQGPPPEDGPRASGEAAR
jgi:hypothetical protein